LRQRLDRDTPETSDSPKAESEGADMGTNINENPAARQGTVKTHLLAKRVGACNHHGCTIMSIMVRLFRLLL
jgi:hypothetical protein